MSERQKRQKLASELTPEAREAIFDVFRSMTSQEIAEFMFDLGYRPNPA